MSEVGAYVDPELCSFCGRTREECGKLVLGAGVAICLGCTQNALNLHETAQAEPATEPWREMNVDEVLDLLPKIAGVASQVETRLAAWVDVARTKGASWARVGESLGMTRQSAWERFK